MTFLAVPTHTLFLAHTRARLTFPYFLFKWHTGFPWWKPSLSNGDGGKVLKLNSLLKQQLAWVFLEELRHMKITGRHLHTLCQSPNLQTSRPLWKWKALFQAHQEVDPLADGQREHVSYCEQSHSGFQCTLGWQVSWPSDATKNTAMGKESIIFMVLPSLCHRALFLPQGQKHVCLSGVWCPWEDRHIES